MINVPIAPELCSGCRDISVDKLAYYIKQQHQFEQGKWHTGVVSTFKCARCEQSYSFICDARMDRSHLSIRKGFNWGRGLTC